MHERLFAAFEYLNAMKRRAWKSYTVVNLVLCYMLWFESEIQRGIRETWRIDYASLSGEWQDGSNLMAYLERAGPELNDFTG